MAEFVRVCGHHKIPLVQVKPGDWRCEFCLCYVEGAPPDGEATKAEVLLDLRTRLDQAWVEMDRLRGKIEGIKLAIAYMKGY